MKQKTVTIIILANMAAWGVIGCFGPPFPEKNGREYLVKHGCLYAEHVVNGDKLEHSQVLELSKCKDVNTRFLIARNPNLTHDEIEIFIHDNDDFVRSGAAQNMNLSLEQIAILSKDSSHTVYAMLAANPSLSEDALMHIHKERNPGLLWFADNPNCPDSIRQEILKSDDVFAKKYLEETDYCKREGIYKQDKNGRWYRAMKNLGN
jgi:hypothetical protein